MAKKYQNIEFDTSALAVPEQLVKADITLIEPGELRDACHTLAHRFGNA